MEPHALEESVVAFPADYEEPYAISPNRRTVDLHYVDDTPAWRVVVLEPDVFRNVETSIDFALFKLRTAAVLAYCLWLYDIPNQPYFVHRVLTLDDHLAFQYLQRMADLKRLVVQLGTAVNNPSVTIELALEGVTLSAMIEEGLRYNLGLQKVDGLAAINEYMDVFNEFLGKNFKVAEAWQAVRRELSFD